jgi:hypothetical protein
MATNYYKYCNKFHDISQKIHIFAILFIVIYVCCKFEYINPYIYIYIFRINLHVPHVWKLLYYFNEIMSVFPVFTGDFLMS